MESGDSYSFYSRLAEDNVRSAKSFHHGDISTVKHGIVIRWISSYVICSFFSPKGEVSFRMIDIIVDCPRWGKISSTSPNMLQVLPHTRFSFLWAGVIKKYLFEGKLFPNSTNLKFPYVNNRFFQSNLKRVQFHCVYYCNKKIIRGAACIMYKCIQSLMLLY